MRRGADALGTFSLDSAMVAARISSKPRSMAGSSFEGTIAGPSPPRPVPRWHRGDSAALCCLSRNEIWGRLLSRASQTTHPPWPVCVPAEALPAHVQLHPWLLQRLLMVGTRRTPHQKSPMVAFPAEPPLPPPSQLIARPGPSWGALQTDPGSGSTGDASTRRMGRLSHGIVPLIAWCFVTFQTGKGDSGFPWGT